MLPVVWVSTRGVSQVAYQTPPFPRDGVGGWTSTKLIKLTPPLLTTLLVYSGQYSYLSSNYQRYPTSGSYEKL